MTTRIRLWALLTALAALVACGKSQSGGVAPAPTSTTTVTSTAPPESATITTTGTSTTRPPIIPVTPTDPATVNGSTTSTPVSPTLTLTTNPTALALMQGTTGRANLTVATANGFNSAVALTITGAPTGTTATLSQTTIPAPGNGIVLLTVVAGSNTPVGSYTLRAVAAGGGLTSAAPIALSVSVFSGNCINPKCGNLGTKIYTADILPLTPPNYQVKYIFFFPNADEKSGLCMDTKMIQYNGKGHWPAGYTIASMYNNRPAPTLGNGQIETCIGSGQDGGICFHRFAGIIEWDSWMIFKIDPITGKGAWATSAAYAYFGKVVGSAAAKLMIDNATNTFLAKYGKYMTPPCAKLPCAPVVP